MASFLRTDCLQIALDSAHFQSLFTAAIEAALLLSMGHDAETLALDAGFWSQMVERSRYVMARHAARPMLTAITSR